jgi:hypothetical protein
MPATRARAENYEILNLCRLIPNLFIFDSRVCLGKPSFAAAPVGPEILPCASRNAFSIIVFSRLARSETNGAVVDA